MSPHPSLYCVCQSRVLVSERIEHPDGGLEVASLTCTYCAACWEAYEIPALPGLDDAAAYTSTAAADLADQELALLLLPDDYMNRADLGRRRWAGGGHRLTSAPDGWNLACCESAGHSHSLIAATRTVAS